MLGNEEKYRKVLNQEVLVAIELTFLFKGKLKDSSVCVNLVSKLYGNFS